MRHDKIISSTQIHAVAFSFLSRKPTWLFYLANGRKKFAREKERERGGKQGRKKGSGREREGNRKTKKRNVRQSDSRKESWRSLSKRPCICIFSCNNRKTFLDEKERKREANDSTYLSLELSSLRRAERSERDGETGYERKCVSPSCHWPGTIDVDFLNDERTSNTKNEPKLYLYPQRAFVVIRL